MRLALLLTAAAALTLTQCAGAPDDDSDALADELSGPAPGPVTVQIDAMGARFTDWGFDIKQVCGVKSPPDCVPRVASQLATDRAFAEEIFGSGNMKVLRIPIRADDKGVDANGHFIPDYYGVFVQAALQALSVNKNVKIFASRSTVSDCSLGTPQCKDFADSLKQGGKSDGPVQMGKYGEMLAEYLEYFDSKGVHVSILGVDNEPTNNEGNITVPRFEEILAAVNTNYTKRMPEIVANDGAHPDTDFLTDLGQRGVWGKVTYASTHYQSDERPTRHAELKAFAAIAHDHKHPLWDTEYHYTDADKLGEYADSALGLYGLFDQFDLGFTGITWWAFHPRSEGTAKAQIQSAFVDSTAGAWPLDTNDGDGPESARGTLTSRAFRSGHDVYVWVVNDTDKSFKNKPIQLARKGQGNVNVKKRPTFEQWIRTSTHGGGDMSHKTGTANISDKTGDALASYPDHSITVVHIEGAIP